MKDALPAGLERHQADLDRCLDYEDYADPKLVASKYRPAVERFLKQALGAETVRCFASGVSRSPWSKFLRIPQLVCAGMEDKRF